MSTDDELDHGAFQRDFSDLHDEALAAERAREVRAHLEACAVCRAEYERLERTLDVLSGLGKAPAPPDLGETVAQTINRRSAGRFFGRKAFGDRVPYELIAVMALVVAVAAFLLLRFSPTGSMHDQLRAQPPAPPAAPGAREVLPARPYLESSSQ